MSALSFISGKIKNPLLQRMFVYAFSDGLSKAVPFLVSPVVAYFLTTEDFGLTANFLVLTGIFGKFVGLNTNTALSVEYYREGKAGEKSLISNLSYLNFSLFLLTGLVILLLNKKIEAWTGMGLYWQILAVVLVFIHTIDDHFTNRLRLMERARFFGTYKFVKSFLSGMITLLFVAVFLWSWKGKIYSQMLAALLMGVFSFTLMLKDGLYFAKPNIKAIKGYFTFCLPLLPHSLSYWLKSGFERIFITKSEGLSDTGIYSFAANVSSAFVLFTTSFFNAFGPYVYKNLTLIEEQPALKKKIQSDIIKKSYYFLGFLGVALILGYFASRVLILWIFKEKFEEAIKYLPFLLGFNFTHAVYGLFSSYVFFTKNTKILGLITFSTAALQALLTIFLVSEFGTIGAAYATLLVGIITAASVGFYSNHVYPMPWFSFLKK